MYPVYFVTEITCCYILVSLSRSIFKALRFTVVLVQTIRNVSDTDSAASTACTLHSVTSGPVTKDQLYLPMQQRCSAARVAQTRDSLKNNSFYSRHVYCALE